MRGTEALEAEEEGGIVDSGGILAPKNSKMNGTNGNKNGASSDVKYPANCAMRLSSTPGSEGDGDDPYEPKQNKKIVRILTVLIYVFTVSFGKFFVILCPWSVRSHTLDHLEMVLIFVFTVSFGKIFVSLWPWSVNDLSIGCP